MSIHSAVEGSFGISFSIGYHSLYRSPSRKTSIVLMIRMPRLMRRSALGVELEYLD